MYPTPEGSPLNHRRGYCADGVKQFSKVEELPPWPQPPNIFSGGHTFYPAALLSTLKDLLECAVMQLPNNLTVMEDEVFASLIKSCLIRTDDGHILFHLFQEFEVDPSTPNTFFYIHHNVKYLHLAYLEEEQDMK